MASHRSANLNILILSLIFVFLAGCGKTEEKKVLSVLAWVGYDEQEFLKPLSDSLAIEIRVKTYVGGDQMYSLFRSAPPGTYDIVVVDAEYGEKMFREGHIRDLDSSLWFASDLFDPFWDGTPAKVGDKVYAAVARWGALGVVFNTKHVPPRQARTYKILWSDRLKARVGMFDWYLPNMGVLSMYLGNAQPFDISQVQLERLKKVLADLRPNIRAIHPNTGDVINDLRTEEVWITPGVGEWAAAVLAEEGKPIDWTVPNEGGVMWVEGFAIPVSSNNAELAKRFIRVVRQPEHLSRLSWRKAYHSQVTRRSAYGLMTDAQKHLLKATDNDSLQTLIRRLSIRRLPGEGTKEQEWIRVWTEFKAGTK